MNQSNSQKRLFIAVPLPKVVKDTLSKYLDEAKDKVDIKWVHPSKLHMTLAFLGDTDEDLIPDIKQAMHRASEQIDPFAISLQDIGFFPNEDRRKVMWLGVDEGQDEMHRLARQIRSKMKRIKAIDMDEKPFTPHLTLARNGQRNNIPKDLPEPPICSFEVDRVTLYESKLQKPRAKYIDLHTQQL